jgi:hypothetical protein
MQFETDLTIDMLYLIGARDCPDGGRDGGRRPRGGRGDSDSCFNCGRPGHLARDCRADGTRGGRGGREDRGERGGGAKREKLTHEDMDKKLDAYWDSDADGDSKAAVAEGKQEADDKADADA